MRKTPDSTLLVGSTLHRINQATLINDDMVLQLAQSSQVFHQATPNETEPQLHSSSV